MEELFTRTATLEPATFDPERRTVEVVFATTAPVRRFDLEGPYQERLDLSPTAVDLSQLIGGPASAVQAPPAKLMSASVTVPSA